MAEPRLHTLDRSMLATLEGIVYGNPFSDEGDEFIQRLVPGCRSAGLERDREALAQLVEPLLQPYSDFAKQPVERDGSPPRRSGVAVRQVPPSRLRDRCSRLAARSAQSLPRPSTSRATSCAACSRSALPSPPRRVTSRTRIGGKVSFDSAIYRRESWTRPHLHFFMTSAVSMASTSPFHLATSAS